MKIKAVERIVKNVRQIRIHNDPRYGQWIEAGGAMYPLEGLPRISGDQLLALLDVPEDKRNGYEVINSDTLPRLFDYEDSTEKEEALETSFIRINYCGTVFEAVATDSGMVFIDIKLLKPFDDLENGIALFERRTVSGDTYIAVKSGLLLKGIILPAKCISERLSDELTRIAKLTALALENDTNGVVEE